MILEDTYGIRTIDRVQTDCASVSYQIVEELIQNGHQKIGIICGSRYSTTAKERLNGYLRVMEDYEIPLRKEYLIEGNYDYASGYEGIHKIRQLPDPPTAVFITNYHMSVGALTAVNQMKIRVPDDLSLAAFDDMELCSIVRPGLTAVRKGPRRLLRFPGKGQFKSNNRQSGFHKRQVWEKVKKYQGSLWYRRIPGLSFCIKTFFP